MVSNGSDDTMLRAKKELVAALKSQEQKPAPKTYYAKNAAAKVVYAGKSFSLKAQLFMDYLSQTNFAARLPFPPVVIAELEMTDYHLKARSKPMSFDRKMTVPVNVNTFLHPAILGRVPQFYKLFGMKSYEDFDAYITEDNLYCLSHKNAEVGVQLLVDKQYQLKEYTLSAKGYTLHQANADFAPQGDLTIPKTISLDLVSDDGKVSSSAVITLNKVVIDGTDRLSY